MSKPMTPYQRLMERFREFCNEVQYPRTKTMWTYPKARLNEGWSLNDLWERVAAAEQLGFDVQLSAADGGLIVTYVKKRPETPWDLR